MTTKKKEATWKAEGKVALTLVHFDENGNRQTWKKNFRKIIREIGESIVDTTVKNNNDFQIDSININIEKVVRMRKKTLKLTI